MPHKIGIPKALIYYKFAPMWKTFFEELGLEVIISPETTKKIRELAISSAPDEDCYTTKLYFGHTMYLKNKVDFLFIPRFGSKHKTNIGCPKFIGLADVLRSMYSDLPEIIMPHFNIAKGRDNKVTFFIKACLVGLRFTKNPVKIIQAFRKAMIAYKQYKKQLIVDIETLSKWEQSEIMVNDFPILKKDEKPLKIALVGHSYVINDSYCSLDIRNKLRELGVDIITSEQMPRELIEEQLTKHEANLYFDFEREILGTILYFIENKVIDGIIHLMIFGCGPDSLAGEVASRFSRRNPVVPLLQLVIDDLTAETGMKTRIEAFTDMLRRRNSSFAFQLPALRIT